MRNVALRSWTLFAVIVLASGCSRKADESSRVSMTLPPEQAVRISEAPSVGAMGACSLNGNWGKCDPTTTSDINCYALMVEAPNTTAKVCKDKNGAVVIKPAFIGGMYPPGKTITLDVDSGVSRRIALVGFVASSSADCGAMTAAGEINRALLSPGQILDEQTLDLSPGDKEITLKPALHPEKKIDDCEWPAASKTASLNFSVSGHGYSTIAGTPVSYTFTLTNSGTAPALSLDPQTGAPFSFLGGDYPGTGGTCGPTVAAGTSCTMNLAYSPTLAGSDTGQMILKYHNGNSITSTGVWLTGTSSAVPLAVVALNAGYDGTFADTANGSSTLKVISIKNTGTATATGIASSLIGQFGFTGGSYPGAGGATPCGASLAANATCDLDISFSPNAVTSFSQNVVIYYYDGSGSQVNLTIPLSGNGTSAAAPTFTSFVIAGGAYTQTTSVTLTSVVSGATEMYITNTSGCSTGGTWEPYAASRPAWTLGQTNTTAAVYVKYRGSNLVETSCVSDVIDHDNVAPTASVSGTPSDPNALSAIDVTVSGTGLTQYKYKLDTTNSCTNPSGYSSAIAVATHITDSTATNATYYLCVIGGDAALNFEDPTTTAHVYSWTRDNTAPTIGTFEINGGGTATSVSNVTLGIAVSNATEMWISDAADFSSGNWETIAATKSWTLSALNQSVNVYAKFRGANLVETSTSASIIHDDQPPTASASGAPTSTNNADNLNVTVGGAGVTQYKYKIVNTTNTCSSGGYSSAIAIATPITDALSVEDVYYLCILGGDALNNFQLPASATYYSWTRDKTGPAAFTITGAYNTGAGDNTADAILLDTLQPYVNWADTTGEAQFEVQLFAMDGTTALSSLNIMGADVTDMGWNGSLLPNLGYNFGDSFKVSVVARDAAGNPTPATNNMFVVILSFAPVVQPTYGTNGTKWNDYVNVSSPALPLYQQADAACSGSGSYPTDCINGGLYRRAMMQTVDCTGLTAEDNRGAFNWVCDLSGGTPYIYSTGLKPGKGLRDLLNPSGPTWNSMQLIVYKNGIPAFLSAPSTTWWTNDVIQAPASGITTWSSGADAGDIIFVTSQVSVNGYNLNQDRMSLVTAPGAQIVFSGGSNTCNATTGESSSVTNKCSIAAGSNNYLWIEADVDLYNQGTFGVFLNAVKYSEIHNTSVSYPASGGNTLVLQDSDTNRINGFYSVGGPDGLWITDSSHNVIHNVRAFNHVNSAIIVDSDSSYNQFDDIITANSGDGFKVQVGSGTDSTGNTISHLTSVNNTTSALEFNYSTYNTASQILGINSASGLSFQGAAQHAIVHTAAVVNNDNDINSGASVSYVNFLGPLRTTTNYCNIAGGTSFSIGASCNNIGGFPGYSSTTGFTAANIFIGALNESDYVNASENTGGTVTWALGLDYFHFDNSMRGWGKYYTSYPFPHNGHRGSLSSGVAQIWDYTLQDSDAVARGVNSALTLNSGDACPATINGTAAAAVTMDNGSPINTYLVNAQEIIGDAIGDEDGFCETGESCIFSPHIGAYQGSGSPYAKSCIFSGGSAGGQVNNVTMYGYGDQISFSGGAVAGSVTGANNSFDMSITSGSQSGGRANMAKGKSSGKWYYEVELNASSFSNLRLGIAQSSTSLSVSLGDQGSHYSYGLDLGSGSKDIIGNAAPILSTNYPNYIYGSVVSVAVDLDSNVIYFSDKNGNWLGGSFPGVGATGAPIQGSTTYVPAFTGNQASTLMRFNFGQRPFLRKVPPGFHPGWYD